MLSPSETKTTKIWKSYNKSLKRGSYLLRFFFCALNVCSTKKNARTGNKRATIRNTRHLFKKRKNRQALDVDGLSMVEHRGIEPLASRLRIVPFVFSNVFADDLTLVILVFYVVSLCSFCAFSLLFLTLGNKWATIVIVLFRRSVPVCRKLFRRFLPMRDRTRPE